MRALRRGSRSPMKGPSGIQWGSRGEAPESSCVFQRRNNIFNANLYRHKIANIGLGGRFSTLGGSNNCEQSEQTEHLREASTGVQGACVRKFCILQAKYAYFQALCGLNLLKYVICKGYKGAAKFCELNIHKFGSF